MTYCKYARLSITNTDYLSHISRKSARVDASRHHLAAERIVRAHRHGVTFVGKSGLIIVIEKWLIPGHVPAIIA